jgi:hypothetical protein
MKPLLQRSLDMYRLKPGYRYLLAGFLVSGLVAGLLLGAHWIYGAQIAAGLTPGAPLGSEPGSIVFLCKSMALALGAGLSGMAVGAFLLCLLLAALRRMPFHGAIRAVFLCHYPPGWFRRY